MPTTAFQTYSNSKLIPVYRPDLALLQNVAIVPSVTLAQGTVMGELTATPGTFKAYAVGNADGSQVAKGILQYAVTTDASGNVTLAGEFGQTSKAAPIYFSGSFRTQDLVGLDAGAVTNLGGSLAEGSLTTGIVRF
ncbi:MAG TPA: head decoration protein [Chloroflexota bacterium]|jgi:hypothetical protein|nr:head decoration protein [Chloroflexota bacterium]